MLAVFQNLQAGLYIHESPLQTRHRQQRCHSEVNPTKVELVVLMCTNSGKLVISMVIYYFLDCTQGIYLLAGFVYPVSIRGLGQWTVLINKLYIASTYVHSGCGLM